MKPASRTPPLFPVLVLCAATLAVFGAVANFGFVAYDDTASVYKNPFLNPVNFANLCHFWLHSYDSLYTPVTYSVRAALACLARLRQPQSSPMLGVYDLDGRYYHVANLALHLINVLLVYSLLRLFVRRPWAAACGALLFAVHPLQVETVAWITELKGVLCGTFELLALRLYLHWTDSQGSGENQNNTKRGRAYLVGATLCYVLALLSKPTAVVLPFVAWLLGNLHAGRRTRPSRAPLILWLAMAVALAVLTHQTQPVPEAVRVAWWLRPFVAGDALAFYICKLFAPVGLSTHYGRTPHAVLGHALVYATWLLPAALAALGWRARRGRPWLPVSVGIFIVALLPNLGLMPFIFQIYSTVADRYAYLAMLGPALAFACALETAPVVAFGIAGALLLGCAALCRTQVASWRDTQTLFTHTARSNPDSWVAHESLGAIYNREGKVRQAIDEYKLALTIKPDSADLHSDYASVLLLHSRLPEAQAQLQIALGLEPDNEFAQINMGNLLRAQDRPAAAIPHYLAVLRKNSDSPLAHYNLGLALIALGKVEPAVAQLRLALAGNPYDPTIHLNLANALEKLDQSAAAEPEFLAALRAGGDGSAADTDYGLFLTHHGRATEAVGYFSKVARQAPGNAEAHYNLGLALGQANQLEAAARQFRLAIGLNPKYVEAHYNLGIAAIMAGHTAEAVLQWRLALQIDGSYTPAREALAATTSNPARSGAANVAP